MLRIVSACLIALSCSCIPECVNPAGDAATSLIDPQLAGHWKYESGIGGDLQIVAIGKSKHAGSPRGLMKFVATEISKDHKLIEKPAIYFFPTQIAGKWRYMNLTADAKLTDGKFVNFKGQVKRWIVARYKVEKDRLTIWYMETDRVAAAIKAARIQGIVSNSRGIGGGGTKTAKINSSTKDLRKFLASGGDKALFDPNFKTVFRRVK